MAETGTQRLDRQMKEMKIRRRQEAKRERERERRKEQRRRQVIGRICVEHGDAALMAQIHELLKQHAPVSDFPLWPDLFPEQAEGASKRKATSKKASQPEELAREEDEAVLGDGHIEARERVEAI